MELEQQKKGRVRFSSVDLSSSPPSSTPRFTQFIFVKSGPGTGNIVQEVEYSQFTGIVCYMQHRRRPNICFARVIVIIAIDRITALRAILNSMLSIGVNESRSGRQHGLVFPSNHLTRPLLTRPLLTRPPDFTDERAFYYY